MTRQVYRYSERDLKIEGSLKKNRTRTRYNILVPGMYITDHAPNTTESATRAREHARSSTSSTSAMKTFAYITSYVLLHGLSIE